MYTVNPKKTVLVWPVGVLYRGGNAVHWNVFIYKRGASRIIRFDPASSTQTKSCYVYSDAVVNHISAGFGKRVYLVPLEFACQMDSCGADHFCQTWIIFLADYYLHAKGKQKLTKFEKFDFKSKGKPLLKSWLRCIYKHLYHGPTETWFKYAGTHFPGLFYYRGDNGITLAPDVKATHCWQILLK